MSRVRFSLLSIGLLATCALVVSISLVATSCSQTPLEVPVRSFERAGRMDVVCMQVLDDKGTAVPAVAVTQDHCAPVATGLNPNTGQWYWQTAQYHLMAVVTQTLRGELAVVDLTAAQVVDTSRALPGTNFLPVGQNPQDVVATPDGQMVFVTAAEVNKPAIYGIPSSLMLGDAQNFDEPSQAAEALSLTSWPSCALPQAPGRMVVVPTPSTGGDAGVPANYEIVVLLPGNGRDETAKVALLDVSAFEDGTIPRGSLAPCPIKSAIELGAGLPSWTPGPSWPNGLPYVDGGVDLFAQLGGSADAGVLPSTDYQLPLWSCPALAHPAGTSTTPDASSLKQPAGAIPHPLGIVTDGRFVFVSDLGMPLVHVVDASQAGKLREVAPLVATSLVDPSRIVTTSELALSPTTRDYKRYLYAVDNTEGSLVVYDVTDPESGPRSPMTRPNPELDPLQPSDRILFTSPVSTISFAHHDFPITSIPGQDLKSGLTGLLCNPNPKATDPGIYYRGDHGQAVPLGPARLRGVFAFATLSDGQVATIDVDDWDAPCRRPSYLGVSDATHPVPGSLSVPQPSLGDTDPYHSPSVADGGAGVDSGVVGPVTNETFWPVILPNRARSMNLLMDDLVGIGGLHDPALVAAPQLIVNGAPVTVTTQGYPLLNAAAPAEFAGLSPSPATIPNVWMAHDTPDVHADQDWTLTYEGALPGFNGIAGTVDTTDDFVSLTITNTNGAFCSRGVEDARLGAQRILAMQVDDAAMSKPQSNPGWSYMSPHAAERLADYVQITDDVVGQAEAGLPLDPYWLEDNSCWNDITVDNQSLASSGGLPIESPVAVLRQQVCIDKFGGSGAWQNAQRDFPILEAYDDHLVLGRYLYTDPVNRPTNGRVIAPRDTTHQVDFEMVKCCFHNQAHFTVRTGAEWVAVGSVSGYLHHVVADASKACVQSCESREVLLNARLPEFVVPAVTTPPMVGLAAPNRNSPFALRNPSFSTYLEAPQVTGTDSQNKPLANTFFSISTRDIAWKLTTRGQYMTQIVSLVGSTTAVVPQSSMFVAPLGMLAVVDGSAEGLFLIDLNTLSIAGGSPFF